MAALDAERASDELQRHREAAKDQLRGQAQDREPAGCKRPVPALVSAALARVMGAVHGAERARLAKAGPTPDARSMAVDHHAAARVLCGTLTSGRMPGV